MSLEIKHISSIFSTIVSNQTLRRSFKLAGDCSTQGKLHNERSYLCRSSTRTAQWGLRSLRADKLFQTEYKPICAKEVAFQNSNGEPQDGQQYCSNPRSIYHTNKIDMSILHREWEKRACATSIMVNGQDHYNKKHQKVRKRQGV